MTEFIAGQVTYRDRVRAEGGRTVCAANLPYPTFVNSKCFKCLANVLMTNKTKGQRMRDVPETTPPGGCMMDGCLQLMPAPSLVFILVTMPFWFVTDKNFYGYMVKF